MWEYFIGGQFISLIKKPGLDFAFSTLQSTTGTILSSIKYLTTNDQPSVKDACAVIDKMDLEAKIKFIQSFNLDLQNDQDKMSNSVKVALAQVIEITELVDKELDEFRTRLHRHNKKYFVNWRSFNCEDLLINLQNHKTKLDDRLNLLLKACSTAIHL